MELIGQSQQNRVEFETLFTRSYQRAYNLAYRFTGNDSDAEDLTQDAYVRAWGSYHRYDRKRSFEVWLLRILSNLAIDRWRRQNTLRTFSLDQGMTSNGVDVLLSAVVADKAPGPEQQCISRLIEEQIMNALRLLPEAYREAIVLTDLEEWSYEEVASKMRCPVGTVRSRLHRGRQLLRQHLSRMQVEEALLSYRSRGSARQAKEGSLASASLAAAGRNRPDGNPMIPLEEDWRANAA